MDRFVNGSEQPEVLVFPGWGIPPDICWNNLSDFTLGTLDVFDYGFFSNNEEPLRQPASFMTEEEIPPVLVGHSFGALSAIKLAIANPEKVTRLVLFSPFISVNTAWVRRMRALLRQNPEQALRNYLAESAAPDPFRIQLPDSFNLKALEEGLSILEKTDLTQEMYLLRDLPVFMFESPADQIVPAAETRKFAEKSSASVHAFDLCAGNLHYLVNPSEAGIALQEMSGL